MGKRRAPARARTHRQANHQRVDTGSSVLYNSMATYYPNDKELASIQANKEYRRNILNGHRACTFGVLFFVLTAVAVTVLVAYFVYDLNDIHLNSSILIVGLLDNFSV